MWSTNKFFPSHSSDMSTSSSLNCRCVSLVHFKAVSFSLVSLFARDWTSYPEGGDSTLLRFISNATRILVRLQLQTALFFSRNSVFVPRSISWFLYDRDLYKIMRHGLPVCIGQKFLGLICKSMKTFHGSLPNVKHEITSP